MNSWLVTIFMTSFLMLEILSSHQEKALAPYFKPQRSYKLDQFQSVKEKATESEVELLELWESMLTGRSAPISKWIKDQYKILGLNHLFTPSGFHLSAVLTPLFRVIKNLQWKFWILCLLSGAIFCLSGQGALKRMTLIKLFQHLQGQKLGFAVALVLDVLFGTFTDLPLSFCYSFLFLGIIYSGSKLLFLWFFTAQLLIAYFNGQAISPLIILLSPLINLAFALAMPLLFVLAFPLWNWQLNTGLFTLQALQKLVIYSAKLTTYFPFWEVTFILLISFYFLFTKRLKTFYACLLFNMLHLNPSHTAIPTFGKYEFVPSGRIIKVVAKDFGEIVYWSDGRCKRELIRGIWWEKCSPRKRRAHKKA